MYSSFTRLFKSFKPHWRKLLLSQILLTVAVVMTVRIAALNGRLVSEGIEQGDISAVINISVLMIALAIIQAVCTMGNSWLAVLFSEGTAHELRVRTFARVQHLSFGDLDRFRTGQLLTRMTADVQSVKMGVLMTLMMLLQAPITIVLSIVQAAESTPQLLYLMVIIMLVITLAMIALIWGIRPMFIKRQAALDRLNNTLQENLSGVRVVKAFVREETEMGKFTGVNADLEKKALAPMYRIALLSPMMSFLIYAGQAFLFAVGGQEVFAGNASLGEIVTFVNLLVAAVVPMAMLAILVPITAAGEASMGRIFEVLDAKPEVTQRPDSATLDLPSLQGRITFEDVSFAYRAEDGTLSGPVLKDVNLVIEPGQTVGFLGSTGSGKSTLVGLVPRFYDVTAGRVAIDGVDVRDIPMEQLPSIVGTALQEAVLFSGTVRGNITFGRDVDENEMVVAAQASDAHEFVARLPERYDSRVARRGANFSGGQRQRLAIARAAATMPKVLILDDSTSALDLGTESRVQESIGRLMPDTTKLYVAQRISSVLTADQIVLLDNGSIAGIGNHDELLASNDLYREIYESQLGPIPEGGDR
jgi:ABC-type multidrug transport system fused ATPase/permease subunit